MNVCGCCRRRREKGVAGGGGRRDEAARKAMESGGRVNLQYQVLYRVKLRLVVLVLAQEVPILPDRPRTHRVDRVPV